MAVVAAEHTIIIADDHPLFRAALQQALSQGLGNLRLVEAEDFSSVFRAAAANPEADLILLDLHMPGACRGSRICGRIIPPCRWWWCRPTTRPS